MNKIVCLSQIFTLIVYIVSIILLRETIDLTVIDALFIKNVLIIVLLSWGPLQIIKLIRIKVDPTESEKIMRSIQISEVKDKP